MSALFRHSFKGDYSKIKFYEVYNNGSVSEFSVSVLKETIALVEDYVYETWK